MANIDIGPLLAEIGQLLAVDVRANPDGAFLYVEAGEAWVQPSIFQDIGNSIVYRYVSHELGEKLSDLWYEEEPDKRWSTMQYDIRDGRFTVKFGYEPDAGDIEAAMVRREALVRARFGDKPIDYSDP